MIFIKHNTGKFFFGLLLGTIINFLPIITAAQQNRQKISINNNWRFIKGDPADGDSILYDIRPQVTDANDNKVSDSKPTEAAKVVSSDKVLKKWILPAANDFIKNPAKHHQRPDGNSGGNVSFVQNNFNDKAWEQIDLPHGKR